MKITIKNKEYKSRKISGRIYDHFLDITEEIEQRQKETGQGFSRQDMSAIRDFLVELYDNQFTVDDLYDETDVATVILQFMGVSQEIENSMSSKLEKLAKK